MRTILFSAPMVAAIRAGRKTQTRRVVRMPSWAEGGSLRCERGALVADEAEGCNTRTIHCPYGSPGEALTVLCTWAADHKYDRKRPSLMPSEARFWSLFDGPKPAWAGKNRPGRFMPTFLRERMPKAIITAVRAERVQDISEADAIAEGFPDCGVVYQTSARERFMALWQEINGKRKGCGWDANPYVWCVSFAHPEHDRIDPNNIAGSLVMQGLKGLAWMCKNCGPQVMQAIQQQAPIPPTKKRKPLREK